MTTIGKTLRIRFSKQGDLRLISHRDLMRALERLFRRSGITVSMSEGFHPKPRMRVPAALALGAAGLDELLEVDVPEPADGDMISGEAILATLNAHAPAGLAFHAAQVHEGGAKASRVRTMQFEMPLPEERTAAVERAIERLLNATIDSELPAGEPLTAQRRALLEQLDVTGGVLHVRIRTADRAGIRPRDLLSALGLDDLSQTGAFLTRTGVELEPPALKPSTSQPSTLESRGAKERGSDLMTLMQDQAKRAHVSARRTSAALHWPSPISEDSNRESRTT